MKHFWPWGRLRPRNTTPSELTVEEARVLQILYILFLSIIPVQRINMMLQVSTRICQVLRPVLFCTGLHHNVILVLSKVNARIPAILKGPNTNLVLIFDNGHLKRNLAAIKQMVLARIERFVANDSCKRCKNCCRDCNCQCCSSSTYLPASLKSSMCQISISTTD